MFGVKFNKNQSGQAALEAAIILIAFVVVASVFAFAVLSAGTASTARGEQSIYSGLKVVQSSMAVKGAVIGMGTGNVMKKVVFDVSTVSGGDPVSLATVTDPSLTQTFANPIVLSYRDIKQQVPQLKYDVKWIVGDGDSMLEEGELAEITATLPVTGSGTFDVLPNTPFTVEIKPPTGAVIDINRQTPSTIESFQTLR